MTPAVAAPEPNTPGSRESSSSGAATDQPAQVLMIVGNDIRHDTRVLKTGLSLADAGLAVTLLGYSPSGRREESTLGPLRIIRVPVAWTLRDAARTQSETRREPHLRVALDPERRRVQDLRASLREREAEAAGGLTAILKGTSLRLGRETTRARAALQRRTTRLERQLWRGLDAARHRTTLAAGWRHVLPEIDDYELAFGSVIDQLEWEVIHAHDVHLVGVASRAVARRRASGRPAAWLYDAHEYVAGLSVYGSRTRRKRAAYLDLEREFIRGADAVITVTQPLAEALQRQYRLAARPAVVMNSPVIGAGAEPVDVGLRQRLGLAEGTTLLVYAGGVTAARGLETAVRALPALPQVHLAVVAVPGPHTAGARRVAELASGLGVSDRVHLLDPVAPEQVSSYVSSADIGLLPLLHFGSHEVALPNKLFEYLHGGLPVLVSDCRAQAEFIREHRVGRVHVAGDVDSFVTELRALLEESGELRQHIRSTPEMLVPFAWDQQETVLRETYRRLLGRDRVGEPTSRRVLATLHEVEVSRQDRPSVLGIGPANMAGQAWAWAKAAERVAPGVRTEVVSVDRGSAMVFEADEVVPADTYAKSASWAERFEAHALETWTHALLEAGRPIFGLRHGRDFRGDAATLRAGGIEVGLVLHGSEIRNPRRHGQSSPWSPFRDPHAELTVRLQRQWDVLHPLVMAFDGPVFVSTPDLLEDVPHAHLLPVVVDVAAWASDAPVMEREVPVVVHAPSRAAIKGSTHVDRAMLELAATGLVEYQRLDRVPRDEVRRAIQQTDIVLDQFGIGSYGVLAAEAMAAGRVVVSHVTDRVRQSLDLPLPIVESAPDRLAEVVRGLVADRAAAREAARAGTTFAAAVHDGRRSGAVLRDVLGLHGDESPAS